MPRAPGKKELPKNKPGRATTYSQAIADEICERLAEGEPLRVICRDEHMPAWRTVYEWRQAREEFSARIALAREIGFDAIAEEALMIADTPVDGVKTELSDNGKKEVHEDMLGHRKLQIETRLKLLAKWSPKKYGEKVQTELTGAGGGPVQVIATSLDEAL
jgi:hypothetical protein